MSDQRLPEKYFDFRDSTAGLFGEIKTELVRKSIHVSIALVPILASETSVQTAIALLAFGCLIFVIAEYARKQNLEIPLVTGLTRMAMRKRDAGRFVLGPLTLAIGAILSLVLFPERIACVAIWILAFGDGIASIVGKLFGSVRLPFVRGKTLEGSLACFVACVLSVALSGLTNSQFEVVAIAAGATILEALPTKDYDNVLLPLGSGALMLLVGL